jgi:hypothetical protein
MWRVYSVYFGLALVCPQQSGLTVYHTVYPLNFFLHMGQGKKMLA